MVINDNDRNDTGTRVPSTELDPLMRSVSYVGMGVHWAIEYELRGCLSPDHTQLDFEKKVSFRYLSGSELPYPAKVVFQLTEARGSMRNEIYLRKRLRTNTIHLEPTQFGGPVEPTPGGVPTDIILASFANREPIVATLTWHHKRQTFSETIPLVRD